MKTSILHALLVLHGLIIKRTHAYSLLCVTSISNAAGIGLIRLRHRELLVPFQVILDAVSGLVLRPGRRQPEPRSRLCRVIQALICGCKIRSAYPARFNNKFVNYCAINKPATTAPTKVPPTLSAKA